MKKLNNSFVFIFFLFLILFRSSIDEFLISLLKEPDNDQTLQISYQNIQEELKSLQESYQIPYEGTEKRIYSKMIYRNPYTFLNEITILKGSKDNLKENMAVINNQGFLGTITTLNDHSSIVTLLTNPKSTLSIKIKDTYGIMTTNNNLECWIENISKDVNIIEGDIIKTSGLTNIPANIPVGKVERVEKDQLGLIQKIKVSLSADFNQISYVVISFKEDIS